MLELSQLRRRPIEEHNRYVSKMTDSSEHITHTDRPINLLKAEVKETIGSEIGK